jgi:hypothetical protein
VPRIGSTAWHGGCFLGPQKLKHTGDAMSVVHQGRTANPLDLPGRERTLTRRLSIVCPETGRTTDTGLEVTEVPGLSARRQVLVDCLECGQDHEWSVDDIRLQ